MHPIAVVAAVLAALIQVGPALVAVLGGLFLGATGG
jgi:hypothetical protein